MADRLCAKVMIDITGDDVQAECLTDQLCSGIKSGIEGSIHALRAMFDELSNDGWGLLLIDASNAFNSVNRAAAIWNKNSLVLLLEIYILMHIEVMLSYSLLVQKFTF